MKSKLKTNLKPYKMKKAPYAFVVLFCLAITLSGCREETTGEKVEDAVESVKDDVEDAVD